MDPSPEAMYGFHKDTVSAPHLVPLWFNWPKTFLKEFSCPSKKTPRHYADLVCSRHHLIIRQLTYIDKSKSECGLFFVQCHIYALYIIVWVSYALNS